MFTNLNRCVFDWKDLDGKKLEIHVDWASGEDYSMVMGKDTRTGRYYLLHQEEKAMNTKFKAMKFNIGDDPELSKKVQELLFGMGYGWSFNGQHTKNTDAAVLSTSDSGWVYTDFDDKEEEINIDWLRTDSPETIELNGKTYVKSELEEAIAKIKPVEGV